MYLKLKVIPDSKQENIEQLKDDEYRIWVKAPAENNRANERVLEIMRDMFKEKRIRLVSGHTSPSKIVSVD
ncbi:MAG: hypothetical protein RIQ41_43 [Candidatus Parcubacteria bacterium]|jgi:uncharacterized protein (TIGR00251 family)